MSNSRIKAKKRNQKERQRLEKFRKDKFAHFPPLTYDEHQLIARADRRHSQIQHLIDADIDQYTARQILNEISRKRQPCPDTLRKNLWKKIVKKVLKSIEEPLSTNEDLQKDQDLARGYIVGSRDSRAGSEAFVCSSESTYYREGYNIGYDVDKTETD